MFIHVETEDTGILDRIREEILRVDPESTIHTGNSFVKDYVPGSGDHILASTATPFAKYRPEQVAEYRWTNLMLATVGARYWTETTEGKFASPFYAGSLDSLQSIEKVVVDARYAENRAVYFASFGVNYLGRTHSDPRTIVLLDNKKDKTHNPTNNEDIYKILTSLPETDQSETSWESIALLSSGNVEKLEAFLDYLSESNVVAYTTAAFSKLKFIGRDYGRISVPDATTSYGLAIREAASRLKPAL